MNGSYHIQRNAPNDVWPRGGWSLYQITGDQIAQRTICDPKTGKIVERHSWCGYIGIFETLPELMRAIEDAESGKIAA